MSLDSRANWMMIVGRDLRNTVTYLKYFNALLVNASAFSYRHRYEKWVIAISDLYQFVPHCLKMVYHKAGLKSKHLMLVKVSLNIVNWLYLSGQFSWLNKNIPLNIYMFLMVFLTYFDHSLLIVTAE